MNKNTFLVNKRFFENMESPIFAKDIQGFYRYCNVAFTKYLALPKEAILGKTVYDLFPTSLADIYAERDQALFTLASHASYDPNGNKIAPEENDGVFNKSIIFNEDQSIAGYICMVSLDKMALLHETADELKVLTSREMQVFNLLVQGKSTKAIARALNISTHTTADHLKLIYRKLGVHSKNEAIYKGLHLFMSHPWQVKDVEQ